MSLKITISTVRTRSVRTSSTVRMSPVGYISTVRTSSVRYVRAVRLSSEDEVQKKKKPGPNHIRLHFDAPRPGS